VQKKELICSRTCFVRDEGSSLGTGMQVQVSNHHWVLQPKVVVLSAYGKGCGSSQVCIVKLNESE